MLSEADWLAVLTTPNNYCQTHILHCNYGGHFEKYSAEKKKHKIKKIIYVSSMVEKYGGCDLISSIHLTFDCSAKNNFP